MKVTRISCRNCQRCWELHENRSLYHELDVAARPCPYCESYTLTCDDAGRPRPYRTHRLSPDFLYEASTDSADIE